CDRHPETFRVRTRRDHSCKSEGRPMAASSFQPGRIKAFATRIYPTLLMKDRRPLFAPRAFDQPVAQLTNEQHFGDLVSGPGGLGLMGSTISRAYPCRVSLLQRRCPL